MRYHVYSDDTQMYLIVEPTENWQNVSSRLTRCLNDMELSMSNNMLKLNEEKTELIAFAPRSRIKNLSETSLLFGKNIIYSVQSVRNLVCDTLDHVLVFLKPWFLFYFLNPKHHFSATQRPLGQNWNFRNCIPRDDICTVEYVRGVREFYETFLQNNMTPHIKLQEFSSLIYKI